MSTLSPGPSTPDRFFIGGEWVAASGSTTFDVVNPTTEEPLYQVAQAQAADIDRAVTAARTAFDEGPWPRMTPVERGEYIRALAAGLAQRVPAIASIWSSEMGILHPVAQYLSMSAAGTYNMYADMASEFQFIERHTPTSGGKVGLLVREPVGVVGAIIPWNGPVALTALKVAPALLAGCTVVVKSSPEAPGAGNVLAEVAEQVGLPAGVLNVVTADREKSELLVRDPRVDKISFTGSTVAGRRIASILGERIGRYTLELGGKSAAIVLDDADLGSVATSLAGGVVVMSGQACAALTRVVISRSRHDDLVDALAAIFSAIQVGDPFDASTHMGPLAMERQLARVKDYIASGKAEGARLASGGGRPETLDRGFFVEPTLFANVSNSSTIAREEIFGPVLSVIPADDEADAIRIANDSIFGLNSAVYTPDAERALHVARQIRSGTVGHNGNRSDFGIAFGGFKQSGVGREGGREGLLPYLETKTVVLDSEPAGIPPLPGS
ncbi:acyl-CoA reductase-like NAD-dependent aldehyde dehydrogenase [Antricoccus suffuscus]|uniref:aldehyde dehydrogenase (NAD(+)) n=1 Tax=Antricoccus suffuscus TaxID=1629062 RepID=A0A2T0ZTR2_9ACTN|nr:aldehyde dehydrogenase [Antricoccus suffuscus]PRZ39713.1 acyl-CoA reductase-like NAD-dependent aldehyde dehydrogenase [Antricoccus suffuscus]